MKKNVRHCVMAFAAALTLTGCQKKPFGELASVWGEAIEMLQEMDQKYKEKDDSESYWEFNERLHEELQEREEALAEKRKKVYEKLDGTEIKTEATEETGLVIKDGFTVCVEEDDEQSTIMLKAKVENCQDDMLDGVAVVGYDGDTPVLLFAGRRNARYGIEFDEEEGVISFQLGMCDAEVLGRVDKIVLTTDLEMASRLEKMFA